jgi:hypothetical protein
MNLTTLLDKIAGRQEERQQAREADFRQLVVEITDGQEPDADEIEHVLDFSEKTLDDLREEVGLLQHRRNLKSMADRASEFEKERVRIETEARNYRHTAKNEREQAKFAQKKPDVEQHRKDAVVFEDNARQLEVQLPALRQQVADLEKQERDIREQMLVP